MSQNEMDAYRELIRENIRYDDYVQEHPYDASQLDEMVELMMEAVCSKKKNIRVAGNDFPQAVVKSRLLKLDGEHIRFVFDCLRENTTQVRNMKQYLLTVLYNAPAKLLLPKEEERHYLDSIYDFERQLTADGIIRRELFPDVPPRTEYSVTDLGRTLLPHVEALINWGRDNFDTIMSNRQKQE